MTLLEHVVGGCIIFVVGAIGGSVFYFAKGTMRSSSGVCRLASGVQAVITNEPRVCRWAVWFAVLSAMETTLHGRHVQGPLNRALAWGAANVLFSVVRSGLKGAAYGGAVGIAFYGLNALLDYLLQTNYFALAPGQSRTVEAPSTWSGRIWGRNLCDSDSSGRFACGTCDCGSGAVECAAAPCSLTEFTLAGSGGNDFYDMSLVDGYNIPMAVLPQLTNGAVPCVGAGCGATGCTVDLNGPCPADLRVHGPDGAGIACKSACETFGRPEDYCSGDFGSPAACRPSAYSMFFKNACPCAYNYTYDDATSTFICASGTAGYLLVFCPNSLV